jgi:hypothetical protein
MGVRVQFHPAVLVQPAQQALAPGVHTYRAGVFLDNVREVYMIRLQVPGGADVLEMVRQLDRAVAVHHVEGRAVPLPRFLIVGEQVDVNGGLGGGAEGHRQQQDGEERCSHGGDVPLDRRRA